MPPADLKLLGIEAVSWPSEMQGLTFAYQMLSVPLPMTRSPTSHRIGCREHVQQKLSRPKLASPLPVRTTLKQLSHVSRPSFSQRSLATAFTFAFFFCPFTAQLSRSLHASRDNPTTLISVPGGLTGVNLLYIRLTSYLTIVIPSSYPLPRYTFDRQVTATNLIGCR